MRFMNFLVGIALISGSTGVTIPVRAQDAQPPVNQSLPIPPPGLGELSEVVALTNKTSHLKLYVRALAEAPYFSIRINVEPGDLGDTKIKASDIQLWAEEELARSAPDAKIMSPEEEHAYANKVYPKPRSAMEFLQRTDAAGRFLEIKLNIKTNTIPAPAAKDTLTCVAIANFCRPAIQPAGFFYYNSDLQLSTGIIPRNEQEKIKDLVQMSVRKFSNKWNQANKPAAEPKPK